MWGLQIVPRSSIRKGKRLKSIVVDVQTQPEICFRLLLHCIRRAASLRLEPQAATDQPGHQMIAITTSNSTNVETTTYKRRVL